MYLLGLGIILAVLKWVLEYPPVASWPWWWVLSPFLGAAIWWTWADWSGYTKRKVMEREDARKHERLNRERKAIGSKPRNPPPPRRR